MIPQKDLAQLIAKAAESSERRPGGNSTVVRVNWHGVYVAVKDYSARSDARIRLEREFAGLSLMWSKGLRLAPQALGMDLEGGYGLQEWVEGSPATLCKSTVEFMGSALRQLHETSQSMTLGEDCGLAADAIQVIGDLRAQVHTRADYLAGVTWEPLQSLLGSVREVVTLLEVDAQEPGRWVPTLSPSDFGPHNIMHEPGANTWRIIDLEFFGWDDAHKLVCDTLMHPLIPWDADHSLRFLGVVETAYELDRDRLLALYPWCSLKWAAIIGARAAREQGSGRTDQAIKAIALARTYIWRAIQSSEFSRNSTGLEAFSPWEPPQ